MAMTREHISHLRHLETQPFPLNCSKGRYTPPAYVVVPFMLGAKEKGGEQCGALCIILEME